MAFKNLISHALALTTGVVIGASMLSVIAAEPKPAFVIVSGTLIDGDGMGPYREKAGPLARAAGIQVLARSDVTVLEGEWPHANTLTIERFDSMQALKDFWYSPGYQEAIKLRAGKFKADFIVAVEATP